MDIYVQPVVFIVIAGMLRSLRGVDIFLQRGCSGSSPAPRLVALATICDVVPLIG